MEEPRSSVASRGPDEQPRLYYLKPDLLNALSVVGGKFKAYKLKEVFTLIKNYLIRFPHLKDAKDPSFINCGGTLLGKAFNVERFHYDDVRGLLEKSLALAVYVSSTTGECSSHINNGAGSSRNSGAVKGKSGKDVFIGLPEIPESDTGPESEYSYQGYETTECRDSDYETIPSPPDGDWRLYSETGSEQAEEADEGEYELATEEEDAPGEERNNDSETDGDSVGVFFVMNLTENEDEVESCFADESDSSDDGGAEEADLNAAGSEDETDRWKCLMCGINNRPFMRYCEKCWQLRKDWYPDPPKRRKKRKSRPKKEKGRASADKKSIPEPPSDIDRGTAVETEAPDCLSASLSTDDIDAQALEAVADENLSGKFDADAPLDLLLCRAESTSSQTTDSTVASVGGRKRRLSDLDQPSRNKVYKTTAEIDLRKLSHRFKKFIETSSGNQWLQSSKSELLLEALESVSSDDSDRSERATEDVCSICFMRPKNASIIHGRLAHVGFCYPCVRRLFKAKARCPVCRRKINSITRNSWV